MTAPPQSLQRSAPSLRLLFSCIGQGRWSPLSFAVLERDDWPTSSVAGTAAATIGPKI